MRELPTCHIWPENWRPFQLFLGLRTQWIVGAGGPVGLNHAELRKCVEDNCPPGHRRAAAEQRRELTSLLLAAEEGALKGGDEKLQAMREKN